MDKPDAQAPGGELILAMPGTVDQVSANSDATVVRLEAPDFEVNAFAELKDFVESHGTLKSLTIAGHGARPNLGMEDGDLARDTGGDIRVAPIVEGLASLQAKLGMKITDRLVFDVPGAMTGLSPEAVSFLRFYAGGIGMDIVGPTAEIPMAPAGDGKPAQRYALMARFARDGSVRHDQDSVDRPRPSEWAKVERGYLLGSLRLAQTLFGPGAPETADGEGPAAIVRRLREMETKESPWFRCHEDQTVGEGEACQIQALLPPERADSRDLSFVRQAGQADEGRAGGAVTADPVAAKPTAPIPSL